MSYLKVILFLVLLIFISSCGNVKKAFTNQKKNSSDEFLVEKKSPLVMPPDYSELPLPVNNDNNNKTKDKKIKSLISSDQDKENSIINDNIDEGQNFENSILKKIKKN